MYPTQQGMPPIPIYPDAVPPIPTTREGWEAWTVADVLNFVSVLLWDPSSKDRAAGWGPYLDQAIIALHTYPWPHDSHAMPMKVGLVEYALNLTPPGAQTLRHDLAEVYAVLTFQKPDAADLIARSAGRASDTVAQGVQQVTDAANRAAPAFAGVGVAALGLGLGWLLLGRRR